jgi:acetyl-CoA acetyltransferase family protein
VVDAVIVDAVRTPLGRRGGQLASWHPVDLAAHTLRALVDRNDVDPAVVDDVIMGVVSQVGEQTLCTGRNAVLAAGFPDHVTGTSVDRQCGSSQQAIHFAAQGVMAGAYDVVIAAGVESMTRVPMGSSIIAGQNPFGPAMRERFPQLVPQGISAEVVAERWELSREELDRFALESHRRAASATAEGRFERQIVPVPVATDDGTALVSRDEGIRVDTSFEKLQALKPSFKPEGGVITAGNSSQISDGAAALLITSEDAAARLNVTPRARFHAFALAGADPVIMLTAPIPATHKVLERGKLSLDDVDRVEINEAFASVVLAWEREFHPDMARVNVNGGAIALGHPLGCSGARLATTLLDELERTHGRFGLQTMCEGGGMANAMIVERL